MNRDNLTKALVALIVLVVVNFNPCSGGLATLGRFGGVSVAFAQNGGGAKDQPVLVLTGDPDEAAKRAKAAFSAQDVYFRSPERNQVLDQVWVLGAELRTCPRSSLNFGDFATRLQGVEVSIDNMDTDDAVRQFVQLDEALPCLTSAIRGEHLWRYYMLQGAAADYAGNSGTAAVAMMRAVAVLPGQPMDPSYSPTLQSAYAESRSKLLAQPRALLVAAKKPLEESGAVVLDGVHIGDAITEVMPGDHLLQVRDRSGAWRGGAMHIRGDEVIAVGAPEDLPMALKLLQPISQKKLAQWISDAIKVKTTKVVIHDGGKELVVLGEGVSFRRGRRLAENAPAFTFALGVGYQRAEVGNYLAWSAEGSFKLWKSVRLTIAARPSVSEPVIHPATGEYLGRMWLFTFAAGPALRLEVPPAAVQLGLNIQLAPNPDGTNGPRFLVGVLATVGVDLQLGKSPLFFRPQVEAGVLNRYFTLRGLAMIGVRTGTPVNPNAD